LVEINTDVKLFDGDEVGIAEEIYIDVELVNFELNVGIVKVEEEIPIDDELDDERAVIIDVIVELIDEAIDE